MSESVFKGKPDLSAAIFTAKNFSMTPWFLIRFSLKKWTYGIRFLPKICSV